MSVANHHVSEWDWSPSSGIAYQRYIELQQVDRSISLAVSAQTAELIGSAEQLQALGLRISADDRRKNCDRITFAISDLSRDIDARFAASIETMSHNSEKLQSALEWGFFETHNYLNEIRGSIDQTNRILLTPSETWAMEQFDIAKRQFSRHLQWEALESVTKAIHGWGSNTGYKTDARFHYLQGTILLGGYTNNDSRVVSVDDSYQAFLLAFRCAQNPDMKGRALTGAARAAYLQHDFTAAVKHGKLATENFLLVPDSIENPTIDGFSNKHIPTLLVLAKTFSNLRDFSNSVDNLSKAIIINPKVAITAAGDNDFLGENQQIYDRALRKAVDFWSMRSRYAIEKFVEAIRAIADFRENDGESIVDNCKPELERIMSILEYAMSQKGNLLSQFSTYFLLVSEREALQKVCIQGAREYLLTIERQIELIDRETYETSAEWQPCIFIGIIVAIFAWVVSQSLEAGIITGLTACGGSYLYLSVKDERGSGIWGQDIVNRRAAFEAKALAIRKFLSIERWP